MKSLASQSYFYPSNFLVLIFSLSPLWWVLGFTVFIYHLAAFIAFYLLIKQREVNLSLFPILLLIYIAFYIFSLVMAIWDIDLVRWLGSLYNLSYWVMGYMIVMVLMNDSHELDTQFLASALTRILTLMTVLTCVIYLAAGNGALEFNSVLGSVLPLDSLPPLISKSMKMSILSQDWLSGESAPRISLLSPYATAYGMLLVQMFVLLSQRKISIVISMVILVLVLSTLSRMSLGLFAVVGLSLIFSTLRPSVRKSVLVGVALFFVALLPVVINILNSIWESVNSVRAGSSELRFLIYKLSWEIALNESPMWGLGIKPRGDYIVPIGSHSTFFGTMLKIGILGLSTLIVMYVVLLKRALYLVMNANFKGASLGAGMFVCILYSFLADIDAPQLVSYLFFFIIGMGFRYNEQKISL